MLNKKILELNGASTFQPMASIERISKSKKEFELSPAQKRMWFMYELNPQDTSYNVDIYTKITGTIDKTLLEKALNAVVERHASLRTTYTYRQGNVVQVIHPTQFIPLEVVVLQKTEVNPWIQEQRQIPFDLEKGPVIRAHLLMLTPSEALLGVEIYHIATDGTSSPLITEECLQLYESYLSNKEVALPELPIEYVDYVHWLKQQSNKHIDYWKTQLADSPRIINLQTDFPQSNVSSYVGGFYTCEVSHELRKQIHEFAINQETTPYAVLILLFGLLLHKYSSDEDINIGSPFSCRPLSETENIVGLFINTLVIRQSFQKDKTFKEMLQETTKTIQEAIRHQETPFDNIIDALKVERNLLTPPLIQVLFNLIPQFYREWSYTHFNAEMIDNNAGFPHFDLILEMIEKTSTYKLVMKYNTHLFKLQTIETMVKHFLNMLRDVLKSPDKQCSKTPFLTPEEHQLLSTWNNTTKYFPNNNKSLEELFVNQAVREPDKIAVAFNNATMTYRELNIRSNQLAHYIKNKGVEEGTIVGVGLPRSFTQIISMLSILKAGGIYMSLDPEYPTDRLEYILKNSAAQFIITDKQYAWIPNATTLLNIDSKEISQEATTNIVTEGYTNKIAYLIYTSGSTGHPKGILGTHLGMVNRLHAIWELYPWEKDERACQKTSLNFVDHLAETLSPLLSGARLDIISQEAASGDIHQLLEELKMYETTRITLVPSLLRMILQNPDTLQNLKLKYVFCSGEELPMSLARQFKGILPKVHLVNLYGSSEVSADITHQLMEPSDTLSDESTPIGRPIANNKVYILDKSLSDCPIGVTGELCASGLGLAAGYINQPELTAEKFVTGPYCSCTERIYRTGDLCRWLPDGTLEYKGRIDTQVKIHGLRIELGEIETACLSYPDIQEAKVIVREDRVRDKRLVVYLIKKGREQQLNLESLRKFLEQKLPEYMVPSAFVVMESFPLTPNKKVDKKAFPLPDYASTINYQAPSNPMEALLVKIWSEVLGLEKVGIQDNFFQIGGNSLLAMQLMHTIKSQLKISLPLASIFYAPNIEKLAKIIKTFDPKTLKSCMVPIQPKGSLSALFAIHPVGGNVLCYADLAKLLGEKTPFYGVQQTKTASLVEMASEYIHAIQSIQPEGPYHLLGWSMGGSLAMEVASQLEQKGQLVNEVVLIDSYVPQDNFKNKKIEDVYLFYNFASSLEERFNSTLELNLEELTPLTFDERLHLLLQKAQKAGFISSTSSIEEVKSFYSQYYSQFITNLQKLSEHKIKKIHAPIITFAATELGFWRAFDISKGPNGEAWRSYTDGEFKVYFIQGNHFNLLTPPRVTEVASILTENTKGNYEKLISV